MNEDQQNLDKHQIQQAENRSTDISGAQSTTDVGLTVSQSHVPKPSRDKRPTKSILKQPTVYQARFNWKRDILQPLNTRLANAAASAANSAAVTHHQDLTSMGLPSGLGAGTGGAGAAAFGQVAAGFWGNALKKLSGVTAAAAGVSAGQSAQSQHPGQASSMMSSAQTHSHASTTANAEHHTANGSLEHGAAPHTPTARATSTSSTVASSPYATASLPMPVMPPQPPHLSVNDLKRVRFRMASLKVVYPINGPNGPLAPYEESKTRERINQEYRAQLSQHRGNDEAKGWTGAALLKIYNECCRTREEPGVEHVCQLLRSHARSVPRVLDLSGQQLTYGAVEALSDLLSIDFGLKKLVLEDCGLDDTSIRPLLHALLVSGNIATLSLAKNKKVRSKGWKYIAIFVRKARFLRYFDLSENNIDRRSADFLVQAFSPSAASEDKVSRGEEGENNNIREDCTDEATDSITVPDENSGEDRLWTDAPLLRSRTLDPGPSTLLSLRVENCNLRGPTLEALAHGVRASKLKHISLRRNRMNTQAAVSLSIMIRDYPLASDPASVFADSSAPLSPVPDRNGTSTERMLYPSASGNSVTARHALSSPFARRTASPTPDSSTVSSPIASPPPPPVPLKDTDRYREGQDDKERELWHQSEARLRLRRQIDELPRTGSLLTLDVKGNDIRNGVFYIAQVLKRNRTLKVLNLSENKIDAAGLTAIGEALKFNTTLETLDVSFNPCCGPNLDGINALRTAIMIHPDLKRIFLNSTDLTSEGAISLAEFLPEAKALIHLDLTGNFEIDIAGVLALSVSVKMNHTIRCLDLNIPPNDSDFARLSQDIMQCCIRNTEQAQEEATSGGKKVVVAAPILKSTVARDLQSQQEAQARRERRLELQRQNKDAILVAAEEVRDVLNDMLKLDEQAKAQGVIVAPSEVVRDALVQAQLAEAQLAEAVAATRQSDQKERAVSLGDALTALLDRAKALYDGSDSSSNSNAPSPRPAHDQNSRDGMQHLASPVPQSKQDEPSSPGFTIGDSEDEDDLRPLSPTPSGPVKPALSDDGQAIETESVSRPKKADASYGDDSDTDSTRGPIEHQSRTLTLEEGEVFRRGTALGAVDVLESDDEESDSHENEVKSAQDGDFARKRRISGEQLRREILDTPVEKRSPRTSFGAEPS
ncbi:hypothetical protein OIO90_001730 [Microbotryomycetes sp. JL221]|nr:hypothetical protein OIO90_001730 [Microbotryomycetes sp. JL221]